MVQRLLHDRADAKRIDLVHAERLDAVLAQEPLLARVDVAQADVHEPVGREARLHPCVLCDGRLVEPEEEGDGHAVDVPWGGADG